MTRYHELRILLPLSLDEYTIGHLYTRYRLKHRENQRSDTQVGQCFPYNPNSSIPTSLNNNTAMYTHHVHLFNGILPQWVFTMLNGSQLKVHGKTWDEFPYIVSKYELPSIARANIQIDFQHFDRDCGNQQNVFQLTQSQLSRRTVEFCDICNDSSIDSPQTDPKLYEYNGNNNNNVPPRGPLVQSLTKPNSNAPPEWYKLSKQFMCAYVLLSASFDLPLQVVRNRAVDLAIDHFSQIVLELHRLAYVWLHEWDQFVVLKQIDNGSSSGSSSGSSGSSGDNSSGSINDGESSTEDINTPQQKVIELFMADAIHNPPNISSTPLPQQQPPARPRRVIEMNSNTTFNTTTPKPQPPLQTQRQSGLKSWVKSARL